MTVIERIYPDPIPVIHPLPEYRVSGQRAGIDKLTAQPKQICADIAYHAVAQFQDEKARNRKNL